MRLMQKVPGSSPQHLQVGLRETLKLWSVATSQCRHYRDRWTQGMIRSICGTRKGLESGAKGIGGVETAKDQGTHLSGK